MEFVNRKKELEILEREWKKSKAVFIVLYGRRRVGKTELLKQFFKNKKGIFFIAEDVKKEILLEEFKNKVADFFEDKFLKKIKVNSWSQLFEYLKKIIPENKRFYIVLDEFSYIVKNSPDILSALQKFWDEFLKETKIFLVLCGSLYGIMREEVLSKASPLYGRRTRDILLKPMLSKDAIEFLKRMSFEDALKTYLAVGGVPKYLEIASDYDNFIDFVFAEFLDKNGFFYREPYFILSQEFKETRTYFSIIQAIAFGNTEPTKIANFVGIKAREIYPYLNDLIMREFVKRVENIFRPRIGIYIIQDIFFDFWFNFVYPNRERIELEILKKDKLNFEEYFGKRFEIFVRDEIFPTLFDCERLGKFWKKEVEVDIVGIRKNEIIVGEIKWDKKVDAEKIVRNLRKIINEMPLKPSKVSFAIFARGFKRRIEEYDGHKVYCFDLNDLENLLTRISTNFD